ncbi:MAG: hypothetical protein LUD47_07850 [Clostridia bacterium]|nr:hypothetical protein [Clostridia bacterium]
MTILETYTIEKFFGGPFAFYDDLQIRKGIEDDEIKLEFWQVYKSDMQLIATYYVLTDEWEYNGNGAMSGHDRMVWEYLFSHPEIKDMDFTVHVSSEKGIEITKNEKTDDASETD